MQHVRHALSAAVIVAVIAAGTAACGSTPKLTANPDPLARLTADQITKRAIADLREATSVRLAGTATSSGKTVGLALTLVRGEGCKGSMRVRGKTLRMVYNGTSVWMLPSDSFYRSQGVNATAISLLSGKWLKLRKANSKDFSSFCSLSVLVRHMSRNPAKLTKGRVTTFDGQRAVTIRQTGQSGTAYISDTAKPEILELTSTKGSTTGTFTFSDYGVVTAIKPPPASKILVGPKFGF
jgi:hypothetical protein